MILRLFSSYFIIFYGMHLSLKLEIITIAYDIKAGERWFKHELSCPHRFRLDEL